MRIRGLCGSLRHASLNRKLLAAAGSRFSGSVDFAILEYSDLPHYNGDLDGEHKPAPVMRLITQLEQADALLFATPEFNHGIPGVLKNALDWLSRPAFRSPMAGKPCGVLTATPGPVGGARAQAEMLRVLSSMLAPVYPAIECLLGHADRAFDEDGELVDEAGDRHLRRYLGGFEAWLGEIAAGRVAANDRGG